MIDAAARARRVAQTVLCSALLAVPAVGGAHGDGAGPDDFHFWSEWSARPGVVLPIAISALIYFVGLARLWRHASVGRGISRTRAGAFTAGLLTLVVALMSPLDALSDALFSVHMVQHLSLIVVAAPLLVLGAPEVALVWSLPSSWRSAVGHVERTLARAVVGDERGTGRGPAVVLVLATAVLWMWHAPGLYDLALRNDAIHTTEHVGFLATSILFWATVLRRPRERLGNGLRILYVFATGLQSSLLGALITFAARPLYAPHVDLAPAWGLSALEDQQIAGLMMWVPPAFLYLGVIIWLFATWFEALGRQHRKPNVAGEPKATPRGHARLAQAADGVHARRDRAATVGAVPPDLARLTAENER
jgi:putative membrane protein